MDQMNEAEREHKARLDAAVAALQESSRILNGVIFSGSYDAIESAYAALRVAKIRFSSAWADYREVTRTSHSPGNAV